MGIQTRKSNWSNSGGNVYYFVQYFERFCLSFSKCYKLLLSETSSSQFELKEFVRWYLKPRANTLDLPTIQALSMLSSTRWAHLNTLLRSVQRCWVLLAQIWNWSNFSLNISFVSLSSMCGSTKSSEFAQQRSTCWSHARAVPSISKNCHGSFV